MMKNERRQDSPWQREQEPAPPPPSGKVTLSKPSDDNRLFMTFPDGSQMEFLNTPTENRNGGSTTKVINKVGNRNPGTYSRTKEVFEWVKVGFGLFVAVGLFALVVLGVGIIVVGALGGLTK